MHIFAWMEIGFCWYTFLFPSFHSVVVFLMIYFSGSGLFVWYRSYCSISQLSHLGPWYLKRKPFLWIFPTACVLGCYCHEFKPPRTMVTTSQVTQGTSGGHQGSGGSGCQSKHSRLPEPSSPTRRVLVPLLVPPSPPTNAVSRPDTATRMTNANPDPLLSPFLPNTLGTKNYLLIFN